MSLSFGDIPLILTSPISGTWEAVLALERRELKMSARSFGKYDYCLSLPRVLEVECSSRFHSPCKVLVRNAGEGLAETLCSETNCANKYLRKINFLPEELLSLALELCSYS